MKKTVLSIILILVISFFVGMNKVYADDSVNEIIGAMNGTSAMDNSGTGIKSTINNIIGLIQIAGTGISIIVVTALLVIVSILTNRNISIASVEELGQSLGIITLVPTVLSVILAFVTHNVIFSLLIGFLSGVLILGVVNSNSLLQLPLNLVLALFNNVRDVVLDKDNIEVLLLCFAVGGMIEVVRSSGGFEALAIRLTKRINTQSSPLFLALKNKTVPKDTRTKSNAIIQFTIGTCLSVALFSAMYLNAINKALNTAATKNFP